MLHRRWPFAATSALLLAWSNLVVPRLPPATGVRTGANLAATGVLVATTRAAGLTPAELGLDPATRRDGARQGAAALAAAAVGYLAVLGTPAGRRALAASAPAGGSARALAARVLVHIPLGTVLCEELAFRGVLLAVAHRQLPRPLAQAGTAVVFGLWHLHGAGRGRAAVAGTVLATGLGGAVLGRLRASSGSVLAPMGLHLGSNALGLLAACAAQPRKISRARSVSASVQPGGGATIAHASSRSAP